MKRRRVDILFLGIFLVAATLMLPVAAQARTKARAARKAKAQKSKRNGAAKKEALELLKSGLAKLKRKQYSAALADLRKGRKLYRHFAFSMFIGP
mgnify:CR=1 FL=1